MNFLVIWFVLWGWGKNWKHLLRFPNLYQQISLLPKICVWRWNKDRTIFLFWIMTVGRWAQTGKAHKESGRSNLFEKWFNWVLAHTHCYKMGTKHFWSRILIFIRSTLMALSHCHKPVLWSKWPLASILLQAIKTCRQACPPGYLMHFS